jgi:hypothetical protein
MRTPRVVVAGAIAGVTLLVGATPAIAFWAAASTGGSSGARAGALSTGPTPTATAAGASVTVSWSAVSPPATGVAIRYQVTRKNTVTSATTPATGGCAGTLSSTSCVEASVPTGRWSYTVQVVVGAWSGAAGSSSNTVAIDATAPTTSAAVIQKSTGGRAGAIHQGGTYRVYANVADTGDPATGVSTVTANVSALTTGATATALTAGSFLVDGVTYGYRSAQLTATNPLAAGTKTFTVTAADVAGNGATTSWSVTVDNTAPAASNLQTVNNGATAGKAETGDVLTLTFTEPIDPQSLLAGWDGGAHSVTIRLQDQGSADRIQIRDGATNLPFGTITLGNTGYVTANRDFTASTMVLSGNTITVTLGTPSGAVGTVVATGTMTWGASNTIYDIAGNTASTTTINESGAADVEF